MKITITKYKCDCCQKETVENDVVEVKIPLMCYGDDDAALIPGCIDICTDCANKFAELYYSIANEHNSTGLRGIC